jgi:hypothetical protein
MRYMLLIVEPRGQRQTRSPDEGKAAYERMIQFGADLQRRGVLKGVESLASDTAATRVAVRAGRRTLVDGPFSEAKEMVGGFFLLDCATKDEAIAIAAQCPASEWATVEVRETAPCYQ